MLKDLILQNPVVSLLILLIPIAGIIWKVLFVLYVKPRDFRILTMERDIDTLRNEVLNIEKRKRSEQAVTHSTSSAIENVVSSANEDTKNNGGLADNLDDIVLNDFQVLLNQWNNDELTALQRKHVEETYIGKNVVWEVLVKSISEEKDGKIWVTIVPPNSKFYLANARAVFNEDYKEALLLIKKGETVVISGVIERFFLSPILKECRLRRK